jgi:hypothetical protein
MELHDHSISRKLVPALFPALVPAQKTFLTARVNAMPESAESFGPAERSWFRASEGS